CAPMPPSKPSPLVQLGRNLSRLRQARHLTQEQVAARAGFASGKYVSEVELGKRDLRFSSLRRMVEDGLGASLGDAVARVGGADRVAETAAPYRPSIPHA